MPLYLFTGENTFTLSEELKRWKEQFLQKHGEANWQMFMGKTMDWRTLLDESRTAPFLSEKRLIVIDGIPSAIEKEDLESLVQNLHPATLVCFIESVPDKRKAVTKFLLKNATVKIFQKQTPKQLIAWLITLAKEHNAILDPTVAAHLVAVVGSDQWHLKSECLKLISYSERKNELTKNESNESPNTTPSTDDINHICLPSQHHTIWLMSDLIGKGKIEEAVKLAQSLHNSGEDAFSLWNIYLWILKNLSTIWITAQEKNLNLNAMSKETGIPFLAVQSLMPCVQKISQKEMCTIIENAVDADHDLKTGALKATGGEPVELITMLERQILLLQ